MQLKTKSIDFAIFLTILFVILFTSLISNVLTIKMDNTVRFLVDSKANILGMIGATFFFNSWFCNIPFSFRLKIVFSSAAGLIFYEFLQKLLPWQTFDKNDIVGTIIGVFIAILINWIVLTIENRHNNSPKT